jgi:hypothetical protein
MKDNDDPVATRISAGPRPRSRLCSRPPQLTPIAVQPAIFVALVYVDSSVVDSDPTLTPVEPDPPVSLFVGVTGPAHEQDTTASLTSFAFRCCEPQMDHNPRLPTGEGSRRTRATYREAVPVVESWKWSLTLLQPSQLTETGPFFTSGPFHRDEEGTHR